MDLFYQLNKDKEYSIIGGGIKSRFYALIILFASTFIFLTTLFLSLTIFWQQFEIEALFAAAILYLIGFFFLIYGIVLHRKNKNTIKKENHIIKNGTLTKGVIIKSMISRNSGYGGNKEYYQHIFTYQFSDLNNKIRTKKQIFTSRIKQNLTEGKMVMVCFDEDDSLILNRYTLESCQTDNIASKITNEESFSSNDCHQSDNILVDTTKKIITYDMYSIYLISGLIISVIGLIVCALVFNFGVMPFDASQGRSIVFIGLVVLLFVVIVIPGLFMIYQYIIKRRNHLRLFKNCKFTYGKLIINNTFSINEQFIINYYYFNERGTKVIGQTRTLNSLKNIPGTLIVAYDENESVLIKECILIEVNH